MKGCGGRGARGGQAPSTRKGKARPKVTSAASPCERPARQPRKPPRIPPANAEPSEAATEQESPPAELGLDYFKTRVERVLRRRLFLRPNQTRTLRLRLTDATTLRGKGLDAATGTLWLLAAGADPESIELRVRVWWDVPGGGSYLYRDELTPLDEVREIRLWEGPIPGPVRLEIEVQNLQQTTFLLSLTGDVMAKRAGGRFDRGMWLLVAEPPAAQEGAIPFDPDHDPEVAPNAPPVVSPCRGERRGPRRPSGEAAHGRQLRGDENARRSGARGAPGSTMGLAAMPGQADGSSASKGVFIPGAGDGSHEYGLSSLDCSKYEQGPGCVPEDDAYHEWYPDAVTRSCNLVDPEVKASVAALSDGLITDGGTRMRLNRRENSLRISLDFPHGYSSLQDLHGRPLTEILGRCRGFNALWNEVTMELERYRMPPARLRLFLTSGTSSPWPSMRRIIPRGDSYAWHWKVTAPWLTPGHDRTWYMASLLNLLHATAGSLPPEIVTLRRAGRGLRRRRACERDPGPKKCKTNNIRANQSDWRIRGPGPPFATIRSPQMSHFDGRVGTFSERTLTWSEGWPDEFNELWSGKTLRGSAFPAPPPIPSRINLFPWTWLPYKEGATKLYAMSRLLVMGALVLRQRGSEAEAEELIRSAERLYRAHLTCLVVPGKTLVHELYHTAGAGLVNVTAGWAVAATGAAMGAAAIYPLWYLGARKKITHCATGCGQEKMGTAWALGVWGRFGLVPLRRDQGTPWRPVRFNLNRWFPDDFFGSGCVTWGGKTISLRTSLSSTPTHVELRWWSPDQDVIRFQRRCQYRAVRLRIGRLRD